VNSYFAFLRFFFAGNTVNKNRKIFRCDLPIKSTSQEIKNDFFGLLYIIVLNLQPNQMAPPKSWHQNKPSDLVDLCI